VSIPLLSADQLVIVTNHLKDILLLPGTHDLVIRASMDYLVTWINGQEDAVVPRDVVAGLLREEVVHPYVVLQSLSCRSTDLVEQAQYIVAEDVRKRGGDVGSGVEVGEVEVEDEWIDHDNSDVFYALEVLASASSSQLDQARKTTPILFRKAGLNTLELY
jgi:hypothetical protein